MLSRRSFGGLLAVLPFGFLKPKKDEDAKTETDPNFNFDDIYVNPSAFDDMKNWDEQTRKDILADPSIVDIGLSHIKDDFGTGIDDNYLDQTAFSILQHSYINNPKFHLEPNEILIQLGYKDNYYADFTKVISINVPDVEFTVSPQQMITKSFDELYHQEYWVSELRIIDKSGARFITPLTVIKKLCLGDTIRFNLGEIL